MSDEVKEVECAPEAIESVPFFRTASMNWAIGIVATGIVSLFSGLCELQIYCSKIPITEKGVLFLLTGAVAVVGGIIWAVKRIKLGNNPSVPLPKITLK